MEVHYESRVVEFAKIADVNNILSTNPDAEFGTSDDFRYPTIFQGAPLHIDIPSWMDLALAGIPESIAARAIEHCNVKA